MRTRAVALLIIAALSVAAGKPAQRVGAMSARAVTAVDVVTAFQAAGLPTQDVVVFDAATDPNHLLGRPFGYLSKVDFKDMRHIDDAIGKNTVEVFATAAAARKRHDYIARVADGAPLLGQYLELHGRALARFDKALLPDEVAAYRAVLVKVALR